MNLLTNTCLVFLCYTAIKESPRNCYLEFWFCLLLQADDKQKRADGGRPTSGRSTSIGEKRQLFRPIHSFFAKRVKTTASDSSTNSTGAASTSQPNISEAGAAAQAGELLTDPTTSVSTDTVAETTDRNCSPEYDVGVYIGKTNQLDDFTKCNLLENPWSPSDNSYDFPYSVHSKSGREVKRYVKRHHLAEHHWLVLSHVDRGLYCKYCTLFAGDHGTGQSSTQLGIFVKKPLKSFAKLFGKDGYITTHENTKYHKDAVSAGKNFLLSYHAPELEVINRVNTQRLKQVQENRARLYPIIETIVLCGRQNIPFRGHRDDGSIFLPTAENNSIVSNEGNFRELLRFRIAAGDTNLEKQLKNVSANATYISKSTQNELINCCGEEIQKIILERVRQAKWFSLIFDETTDASHKEQMSISVRYVHENICREDFLSFIDCYESIRSEDFQGEEKRLSGKALAHIVIDFCRKHSLDLEQNCVGVGSDNCAVMASEVKGAVQEICKIARNAKRCPCLNHTLNNSLKKTNNVIACRNSVAKMKEIISFSNSSAKVTAVFRHSLGRAFSGLCETRWQEKHDGIIQFCTLLPKMCESLEKITKWTNSPETSTKAHELIKCVTDSEFIVTTFALSEVLGTTLPLSRLLQSPTLDAVAAINALKDVLSVLQKMREDANSSFKSLFLKVDEMAKLLDVEISRPRIPWRSVYRANPSSADQGPEAFFRTAIYIPLLDHVVNDLRNRLPTEVMENFDLRLLMPSIIIKTLKESTNMTEAKKNLQKRVAKLSQVYEHVLSLSNCASSLEPEYTIWLEKWLRVNTEKSDIPITALEVLKVTDQDMFPAIHILINILFALPVSVATAERTFSTLRRLKPWLRTRTSEERLSGLALLHIHRDIKIDVENIIDRFGKRKTRKLDFIL